MKYKITDYKEWRETISKTIREYFTGIRWTTLIYHNLDHHERHLKEDFSWDEIFEQYTNTLKSINTKNDALLNLKHENDFIRNLCKYIINGEIQLK